MRVAVVVVMLVAGVSSGTARADDYVKSDVMRERIIVLQPTAGNSVDPKVVVALDDLILGEYAKLGLYDVLGRSEVGTLLAEMTGRQVAGCDTDACLVELGGAVGARFLGISNIAGIGDKYLVNLKIIDVTKAKTIKRTTVEIPGDDRQLIAAVRRGIWEMHPEVETKRGGLVGPVALGAGALAAAASGVVLALTMQSLEARNASTTPAQYFANHATAENYLPVVNATAIAAGVLAALGVAGLVVGF